MDTSRRAIGRGGRTGAADSAEPLFRAVRQNRPGPRGSIFLLALGLLLFFCLPHPAVSGSLPEYKPIAGGIVVRGGYGTLRVEVCDAGVVRVTAVPGPLLPDRESLVVVNPCQDEDFQVKAEAGALTLTTPSLVVKIDPVTGKVSFQGPAGGLVLAEDSAPRKFAPVEIAGDRGYAMGFSFASSPGENYYGLGQYKHGRMRLNGMSLVLEQKNTQIATPFFVSSKGYGVLVDNYSRMKFAAPGNSVNLECAMGDAVDYYFFYGPSLDRVIAGYRRLTGPAPLFPRWAYGMFQSKCIYSTSRKIERVVNEYREREIPMDVIVQDFLSWPPLYAWGSNRFDPLRWPDLDAYVQAVHNRNAKVMISVWPIYERGSKNYREMKRAGYLLNRSYLGFLYDPYNPGAREMYWGHIRDQILVHGYDALWLDATEPEIWKEDNRTWLGSGARYYNPYALMTTRAVYEGWRRDLPDKRLFILTRSAFAGQQRYAAAAWSGDIANSFAMLRLQIPAGLNFCLAGMPYWNTDIGGFLTKPFLPVMTKPELFVRWFQYGVFCPIFRVHGFRPNNELWSYGKAAEQILVDYDRFRYRLLPYIYSQAWQVTCRGSTLMRALVMDFPDDPKAADITDQFMFGPAFLVCPVTREGADSRKVYLPRGADWYDFYTGELIPGGQTIEAPAPLSQIPLYVRAGSLVPLAPPAQYTGQIPGDAIELRIYPGAAAAFTLYDDDGSSYAYERGEYSEIPIQWDNAARTLRIGGRQGTFPKMKGKLAFAVQCVRPGHGVGHGREENPTRVIGYEGAAKAESIECAP